MHDNYHQRQLRYTFKHSNPREEYNSHLVKDEMDFTHALSKILLFCFF